MLFRERLRPLLRRQLRAARHGVRLDDGRELTPDQIRRALDDKTVFERVLAEVDSLADGHGVVLMVARRGQDEGSRQRLILEWIRDHWLEIARIVLTIVLMLVI